MGNMTGKEWKMNSQAVARELLKVAKSLVGKNNSGFYTNLARSLPVAWVSIQGGEKEAQSGIDRLVAEGNAVLTRMLGMARMLAGRAVKEQEWFWYVMASDRKVNVVVSVVLDFVDSEQEWALISVFGTMRP